MAQTEPGERWRAWVGVTALTLVGAAILGYHPYSEDGGIYLTEIKRALDARLYPHGTEFVSGHLGPSVFTAWTGWVARSSGLRLDVVMLGLHLVCLWGMLFGVWKIAVHCSTSSWGRWGAVGLVAVCLRMPVAGTSLLLMDPYVTARSASLALSLLGLAGVADFFVDRRWGRLAWGTATLAGAVVVHPLMGGYAIGAVLAFLCFMSRRRWIRRSGVVGIAVAAVVVAGLQQTLAAPEAPTYMRVVSTRYYWFLAEWRWFEIVGLAAPLAILAWVGWKRASTRGEAGLARMAVCVGGIAVGIAVGFAHETGRVHAVARMQPLRCFQMVYVVMLIVLGARLGERLLRGSAWRWGVAFAVIASLMIFVQRRTYSASAYWELPGLKLENRWEQAFAWVKVNTPKDALFALDADYVQLPGEDGQAFRAIAERSVLPDYSKDGGQAAIRPEWTNMWATGQRAQERLTEETDLERWRALEPLGVKWIVIRREGMTGFACPYANEQVKVCRLP